MHAIRYPHNPIITPASSEHIGENINGPSLVRVPEWINDPLGQYYLYFASHKGDKIHLAYADEIQGPWMVDSEGALHIAESGEGFTNHIASPDVHVDPVHERIRMYYHGCCAPFHDERGAVQQFTRVAVSRDGRQFTSRPEPLGRFYFRVFEYENYYYAFAKENQGEGQTESGQRIYRSSDPLSGFESGPLLFSDGARHTALRRVGDTLDVFYSRIGDAPESILHAQIDLTADWYDWSPTAPTVVLKPTHDWEGGDEPIAPSQSGSAPGRVRELRDPCVFLDDGSVFLLYSVAGESGIAIAEIQE